MLVKFKFIKLKFLKEDELRRLSQITSVKNFSLLICKFRVSSDHFCNDQSYLVTICSYLILNICTIIQNYKICIVFCSKINSTIHCLFFKIRDIIAINNS